jgi:hypothetical protein
LNPPEYAVTAEFGDGYYGVNIWESDFPREYFKRSVYLPVVRDMVPDSLAVFDFPNPNLVGALREETTSPVQALFLLNNALVQNESLQLARRLLENRGLSQKERVRRAYLAAMLREPRANESKRAQEFIRAQEDLLASAQPEAISLRTSTPEPDTQISLRTDTNTVATPGRQRFGPGSSSVVVVAKLAPGVAQPRVYEQPLAEKPASPQEGAWSLFTQALFASAEFRYLQ